MQIVINIDDDLYKSIIGHRYKITYQQKCDYEDLKNAIEDGVPLPKGHKIIDASSLQEHLALVPMKDRTYREAVEIIDRFPSIIEADRSE